MPRPGHEMAAGAARRGSLRASHADRERVVEVLKTAFVEGRLTKDELETRAGRAFASRTYGELAVLTADLPAGLVASPLARRAARARARPPLGQLVAGAGLVIPLPLLLLTVFLTNSEQVARSCLMIIPWYFVGWIVAGVQLIDSWQKRAHGQSPLQPPRGQPPKSQRRGGIGDDLIRFEAPRDIRAGRRDPWAGRKDARADAVPGPGAVRRAWRSLTARRPANLQVTA